MKTKEEILNKSAQTILNSLLSKWKLGPEGKIIALDFIKHSLGQGYNIAESRLSERVKELDENLKKLEKENEETVKTKFSAISAMENQISGLEFYIQSLRNEAKLEGEKLQARIKELEKYNDQLVCAAHDSELKFKELESQQQPVKEEDKKACRSCPNCLSDNVIMFTSDLDLCQRCGQTF